MRQAKNSCVCAVTKEYTYWIFSCDAFIPIPQMNHKEKLKAGFIFNKKHKTYGYPKI
jgi:hypothetical protein